MRYDLDDTIVAISTPVGDGGIGIVRLSGKDSLSIADRIFRLKNGKVPSKLKSYTTHYGHIVDNNSVIDEVILTIMRGPKSYTKEDIVEINCHGGILPLKNVLGLVLSCGARPAQPGEFTKRAFLNGRIDLAQAESVLDVIQAKTEVSLRAAMGQLEGGLSRAVREIRNRLLDITSDVEASIDFPEEDIDQMPYAAREAGLAGVEKELDRLIGSSEKGVIIREGVRAVLCGKPNVGKSSLMNALLRQDRVIVSHIPGTTRDTIEEMIAIDGIPVRLVDTAGIAESDDLITKEGITRSRFQLEGADLVLFMLDAGEPLSERDILIAEEIRNKKAIVVVNKIDLPRKLDIELLQNILAGKRIVDISVSAQKNIDVLESAISEMIWGGEVSSDHTVLVTNVRHKALLIQAKNIISGALEGIRERLAPELLAIEIREAIDRLGEITGEIVDTDILDRIFDKFCIGK